MKPFFGTRSIRRAGEAELRLPQRPLSSYSPSSNTPRTFRHTLVNGKTRAWEEKRAQPKLLTPPPLIAGVGAPAPKSGDYAI